MRLLSENTNSLTLEELGFYGENFEIIDNESLNYFIEENGYSSI
jgi:hypothetical protein